MKKIVFVTLAFMLVFSNAMAQKNTPKKSVGKPLTVSVDGQSSAPAKSVNNEKVIELPKVEEGMEVPLREAFMNRRTVRDLTEEDLPVEVLSNLLWSAYGFNRPKELKRVVPSAVNVQEFDVYVFMKEGVYLYDANKNILRLVADGDHRAEISKQKHFAIAPVSIVLVANYDRMATVFKEESDRDFYAAVDCGYISQNIYLFCAASKLGTVACGGIDRDTIQKILNIKNGRALLAHPVGMIR